MISTIGMIPIPTQERWQDWVDSLKLYNPTVTIPQPTHATFTEWANSFKLNSTLFSEITPTEDWKEFADNMIMGRDRQ